MFHTVLSAWLTSSFFFFVFGGGWQLALKLFIQSTQNCNLLSHIKARRQRKRERMRVLLLCSVGLGNGIAYINPIKIPLKRQKKHVTQINGDFWCAVLCDVWFDRWVWQTVFFFLFYRFTFQLATCLCVCFVWKCWFTWNRPVSTEVHFLSHSVCLRQMSSGKWTIRVLNLLLI